MTDDRTMALFIGYVVAGLISLSLLSLVAFAVAATRVASSTVRANREDEALRADLDRILTDILGSTPQDSKLP